MVANTVRRRNGRVLLRPNGSAVLRADAAAPNGVDLAEAINIEGDPRYVTLTLPAGDYSAYAALTIIWHAEGRMSEFYLVNPQAGLNNLGTERLVLGVCAGLDDPFYEILPIDTSLRQGASCGRKPVDADPVPTMMVVGASGSTTFGYREDVYGEMAGAELGSGNRVFTLFALSPNIVRYRVYDPSEDDIQLPGVDAVNVTLTDITGTSVSANLIWNEASLRYDSVTAAAVYTYLAARSGQTLTVTGLTTNVVISALTIGGTIPTEFIIGQSYTIPITATGGTAPYTFTLRGTWPTGSAIAATTAGADITVSATVAGSYPTCSVRVTDDIGAISEFTAATIVVAAATPLAITGTPLLTATQGAVWAGFDLAVTGGIGPFTFSKVGTWPSGTTLESTNTAGTIGHAGGTPGASGSFPGMGVRVTDSATPTPATADLDTFTLTVSVAGGTKIGFAQANGSNPNLNGNTNIPYAIGDTLIAVLANSAAAVAPTLTINTANPWVLVDSKTDNTDPIRPMAVALYKLVAISTTHTFGTVANANGYRACWAYRGKVLDVVELTTLASGTSITIPEL